MRIQTRCSGDQPRNAPGDNAIGTTERGQSQQFTVGDGREQRCGNRTATANQPGQEVKAGNHLGKLPGPAQSLFADQISGGQGMQPRQSLQRGALPHPDDAGGTAFERLPDPQRTGQHRVIRTGIGAEVHAATVEHRGGPGTADRGLGRRDRPVP